MTTVGSAMPMPSSLHVAEPLPDAIPEPMSIGPARPASPCADPCDRQTVPESQNSIAVTQLNGSRHSPDVQWTSAAVELLFCASLLGDVEKLRIATGNRLAALEREGVNPDVYRQQLHALQQLEHQTTLALQRVVRTHPLGSWIKGTIGVGEKQGARLIAAIDTVSYNHKEGRPRRGPAELWAYCGFAPGQRRRKGVSCNWNVEAKTRAFLVAESCIKHRTSPYRADYDRARAQWADRDTSDAHKHSHALRVVAKAVLRDLFVEARRVAA